MSILKLFIVQRIKKVNSLNQPCKFQSKQTCNYHKYFLRMATVIFLTSLTGLGIISGPLMLSFYQEHIQCLNSVCICTQCCMAYCSTCTNSCPRKNIFYNSLLLMSPKQLHCHEQRSDLSWVNSWPTRSKLEQQHMQSSWVQSRLYDT